MCGRERAWDRVAGGEGAGAAQQRQLACMRAVALFRSMDEDQSFSLEPQVPTTLAPQSLWPHSYNPSPTTTLQPQPYSHSPTALQPQPYSRNPTCSPTATATAPQPQPHNHSLTATP